MVGRTIKDLQIGREVGVIVMAIRRRDGRMLFNPNAETVVDAGDFLIAMGQSENLRALETLLAGSRAARR